MSAPPVGFDYPALLRGSLLGLVRSLIERVAEDGFPGDHHFLLTFATREPGVVMSARLRKRFPEDMTIVLQHQFWNLGTNDDAFLVTLRFGGNPEALTVPWTALREFADPSAGFGFRLQAIADPASETTAAEPSEGTPLHAVEAPDPEASGPTPNAGGSNVLAFGARRRKETDKTG